MRLGKNLFGADAKKVVVLLLIPVVFGLLWLGISLGMREASLPFSVQIDELRLLDPDKVDRDITTSGGFASDAREVQFRSIADCREAGGEHCSELVFAMLKDNPADGRLWLEYARILSQDSGLSDDSVAALRKSYEYSSREGWITTTRTKFALSVWLELPADVQSRANVEIQAAMDDTQFIVFLADIYVSSPTSRTALTQVLTGATSQHQKIFLYWVDKKSNG